MLSYVIILLTSIQYIFQNLKYIKKKKLVNSVTREQKPHSRNNEKKHLTYLQAFYKRYRRLEFRFKS